MATSESSAVIAGVMPDNLLAGVVYCRSAIYEAAAEAINNVIQMVPVPKGALVLDVQVVADALGTGVNLEIGDGDDTDYYITSYDCDSATVKSAKVDGGGGASMNKYYEDDEDTIDAKVLTAAATGTIEMNVFYKMLGTIEDETDANESE